jgi:hypothetical protein
MITRMLAIALLLGLLCLPAVVSREERNAEQGIQRRPVALVLADGGRWLFVANQRGSISSIDTKALAVASELRFQGQLADLMLTPSGQHLLTLDETGHQLIAVARRGGKLEVSQRYPLPPYPVSLVRLPGSEQHYGVASLWSRTWSRIALEEGKAKLIRKVALPFPPREQLPIDRDHVVVADAFAGRLALVDGRRGEVLSVRSLPAHNIRGLALGAKGKRLWLIHQVLQGNAHTTRANVHWGNLLTNNLRELKLEQVRDPRADLLEGSQLYQLDEVRRGAADPAGLARTATGRMLVTLGGVDEVMIDPLLDPGRQRLEVGRRPTAVVVDAEGKRAYIANTLDDTISVVDLDKPAVQRTIPLGEGKRITPVDEGASLFHDARLSHDGWLTCNSCHVDGHTPGLLNDNLGDGSFGAPKRILSLRGVGSTPPYAWDGSFSEVKDQIRKSIITTMNGPEPGEAQVKALAAFLQTLPPVPALPVADPQAVRRGQALFDQLACGRCHVPPTYTSPRVFDVGLHDEVGNKRFNPPSLRGVGQGGPYFHDNRAATLDEVFMRYRHQVKGDLKPRELHDLLAFLRSL